MSHDLAIIGSGSAAFAAAIRARDSGKSVVMIERGTTGGTCVNAGCIPSKALIAAANQHWQSTNDRFPGITTSAAPVEIPALTSPRPRGRRRHIISVIERRTTIARRRPEGGSVADPARSHRRATKLPLRSPGLELAPPGT